MKNITKRNEPPSLTQHRAVSPSDYQGYQGKNELRVSLCSEQRGICCYCMGRIRPTIGSMKIEHWQSQMNHKNQRLDYSNILGACMGREGYRPRDQHCDTYKANRDLCKNPANPGHNVEAFIQYANDGSIKATDPLLDDHLNTVLNLNSAFLKANRKAALDGFKTFLKRKPGGIAMPKWQKFLDEWNGATVTGDLKPYAGVVAYWISKRIV